LDRGKLAQPKRWRPLDLPFLQPGYEYHQDEGFIRHGRGNVLQDYRDKGIPRVTVVAQTGDRVEVPSAVLTAWLLTAKRRLIVCRCSMTTTPISTPISLRRLPGFVTAACRMSHARTAGSPSLTGSCSGFPVCRRRCTCMGCATGTPSWHTRRLVCRGWRKSPRRVSRRRLCR
jgi:hypothetical protein